MKLRTKTLLMVGLTLVGLLVGVFISAKVIVLGGFEDLEREAVRLNVARARNVLSNELDYLHDTVSDEAAWDDTYAFVQSPYNDYIEKNLVDDTFIDLRLNLMLFINSSGQIVWGKMFDLDAQRDIPINQSIRDQFTGDVPLLRHDSIDSTVKGIVLLPEGPMLVVSRPILTSENQGPIRGSLIMGRYLGSKEIRRLADTTLLSIQVFQLDDPDIPPDFRDVQSNLLDGEAVVVQPLNSKRVAGYTLLRDLNELPALILRVDLPRNIFIRGQTTFLYLVAAVVAVGLIFGTVVLLVLKQMVLAPLARLSSGVAGIINTGNIGNRVLLTGRDELGTLATQINEMLDALEASQADLRQTEEKVRQSESHLSSILRSMTDSLIVADSEGRVQTVNEATSRLLGYTPEDLQGQLITSIITDQQLLKEFLTNAQLLASPSINGVETAYVTKSGRQLPVLFSASILRNPAGELQGLVCIARDITEVQALQDSRARIVTAQEGVRRDIAAHLHGQVQGKLLALRGYLQQLQGTARDSQETDQALGKIIDGLGEVIRKDLSVLSRRLYPAILRRGLIPAVQSLGDQFEGALRVDMKLDADLVGREQLNSRLIPEPTKLAAYRIVEEALSNTAKHAKASEVTVELASPSKERLIIRIKDNGQGYRVERNTGGLGTAVMQDYADAVGGKCTLSSIEGAGTEVTAVLPLAELAE
jgi:PAS domain S-box-containing protein